MGITARSAGIRRKRPGTGFRPLFRGVIVEKPADLAGFPFVMCAFEPPRQAGCFALSATGPLRRVIRGDDARRDGRLRPLQHQSWSS